MKIHSTIVDVFFAYCIPKKILVSLIYQELRANFD